ncbi:MAG: imidazole glycerol phosphate synthase subunit HisH [Chloroflexi bacterium]|nr:imidazole glycerol phosphate synthase subunit HisH [Chloroflexota bacterium]|tara:strand:+ start:25202 stop:25831 length:630 start_codon:yes stop_codon:yes gene_type:complete
MSDISILDTKSANFHSVKKAVDKFNPNNVITSNEKIISKSKGLIIPGVSTTDTVLNNIKELNLERTILDFYTSGKPILCICVGMQILFERSAEGIMPGLGILKGSVKNIPQKKEQQNFKVPHMGWNQLEIIEKTDIFDGIANNSNFYFVHSYYCDPKESKIVTGNTTYSIEMCVSLKKNNLYAVQFHPEKSSQDGLKIYENFINIVDRN